MSGKKWIYAKRPEGEVTSEHYTLEQEEIPTEDQLENGEILIKTLYCSVDPYMRIQQSSLNTWEAPHPLGQVQGSGTIGRVIYSKDANIKVGDIVSAYTGWREYAKLNGSNASVINFGDSIPITYALGILGMPGRTAFFGLLEVGKPAQGETLVVSGAAGAVGSIVIQIGLLKGCRVVAIAGGEEKINYLKSLGCETINYKNYPTANQMLEALKSACPNGIDIYFDNVGGHITDAVFHLINLRARIIICGQISQYNGGLDSPEMGPRFLHKILYTRATIQGILARDYTHRMSEMVAEMSKWIKNGEIKYQETVVEGFDNLPSALNMLFYGKNNGKLLVKVSE